MMQTTQIDMPAQATEATTRMFEFTAEHDALRDVLREYFSSSAALDPWGRWRRLLAEVGADDILLGPAKAESFVTAVELAILAEEAGAALFGGPVLSTAALGPLASGVDEWAPVIEQVRAGTRGLSAAVSLTGFGESPVTLAHRAEGCRANGSVEPVWDFTHNGLVAVDASLAGEPAIVVVDGDAGGFAGLSGLDLSRKMGRMSCPNIPPLMMSSGPAAADKLTAIRQRSDLVISAELLGVAQRVLDATVEYVGQRVQFGRTIGSFQAVKHRLADMSAQVELTRSAVYGAAWQLGSHPLAAQTAVDLAVAAVLARDAAVGLTKAAVQLHGGIAITWEHWAHRYLRRAHSVVALTGAASRHRRRLAALIDFWEGADG